MHMVEITILNNAANKGGDKFPQEFSMKINSLSSNPINQIDKKGNRAFELYLVNQNDDFIFPGMALWGIKNKFLIITKFVPITEWKKVPLDVVIRKKEIGVNPNYELFLFKAVTLAPSEQVNSSDSSESMRKMMEERQKNEIEALTSQFQFEIDEQKKRADTWRQMYEKGMDQFDDFTNEQFQKNVDRNKRVLKTIAAVASGEIESSFEQTARIEDRELEGNEDE